MGSTPAAGAARPGPPRRTADTTQPTPLATELLGHPPDTRLLLLNCDDFGLNEDVNLAVVEAVEHGVAASCSLMTGCPGSAHALRLLRERPHLPFGIHLTLVCDTDEPGHRWGPVAPAAAVPSLLDPAGRLFPATPDGRARLLARARADDVEREFRAQIEAAAGPGPHPTHLDFHCLADAGRPDLLDLALALGAEYGLAVRIWLAPALERLRARGLPVVDHPFLDSFSVPLDDKPAHYARLLAALRPGLTEWAVHPGLATPATRAGDGGWRVRRSDHAFLLDPRTRDLLAEHGVTVTDYRPLRAHWARTTGSRTACDASESFKTTAPAPPTVEP
ncbi:hopanoid biosynthesis-associated protein HpnK [Kitasatospora putterlickiae]|uniref:Hopanoid biosynthesis-associated protein HpnK n=1 Tax=Kitasatospora putterlickiae TaxID=221725 RepID=A0ABN1YAA9_9ACTN